MRATISSQLKAINQMLTMVFTIAERLDVVISDAPWAQEAIEHPLQTADGIPVIALPYLVLMKLYAGRSQDIADITRMLGGADELALTEVCAAVARHMPDAANDVESMIVLGRLEYQS